MPMGRTILPYGQGLSTRVSADGNPKYKAGGVMIDLTTVPAASVTDTTLLDGSIVKAGQQYMRFGQILTKVTKTEVQTLTSTATGGTFTVTVPSLGVATSAIAYNATGATIQGVLRTATGNSSLTVTGSASGPWVVTFPAALGNVGTITIDNTSATGGTVTVATTYAGESYGKFGPYDPAATDGRASLVRGEAFILDETWYYYPAGSSLLSAPNDFIGGVFEAGDVWYDRIIQSGVATHTLALGPTLAEFETLFPRISYYKN